MATNKVYADGDVVQFTNTASATIKSGDAVVIGALLGVALVDIPQNETGSVDTAGVYRLPKASAAEFDQGDAIIWDASEGEAISTGAAAGDLVGGSVAHEAAGNGATEVLVRLNVGVATVHVNL